MNLNIQSNGDVLFNLHRISESEDFLAGKEEKKSLFSASYDIQHLNSEDSE